MNVGKLKLNIAEKRIIQLKAFFQKLPLIDGTVSIWSCAFLKKIKDLYYAHNR